MNAENFSQYIENPSLLYQMNYEELKQLILQYPFNANLRYLLVKKSQQEDHRDFERNLKAAAINSPDRKHLYNMLHQKKILAAEELEERLELKSLQELDLQTVDTEFYQSDDQAKKLSFDLSETNQIEEKQVETITNDALDFQEPSIIKAEIEEELFNTNWTPSILSEDGSVEETEEAIGALAEATSVVLDDHQADKEEPPAFATIPEISEVKAEEIVVMPEFVLENSDLEEVTDLEEIESEIEVQHTPIPQPSHRSQFKSWRNRYQKSHHSSIFEAPRYDTASLQIANRSIEDSEELVTETLADLLIKQKRFYKAIEVYERLSLQFPEKSNFFASRIAEIRKEIE